MTQRTPSQTLNREAVDRVVDPICRAHGAEVFDIEFKNEAQGWVLRVLLEKLGSDEAKLGTEAASVDLEVCSDVAKELSPALDAIDVIPQRYNLEVGTPGVERSLRSFADVVRFSGSKAKFKIRDPKTGASAVFEGVMTTDLTAGESALRVADGKRVHAFSWEAVSSAHLVFEFGPAPKPGKRR